MTSLTSRLPPVWAGSGFLADEPSSSSDLIVFWVLLVPAGAVAGVLYALGAATPAFVIAGVVLAVASFISPAVGAYAYLAFQALDAAFTTGVTDVFTPAKALGPFLIIAWLPHFARGACARVRVARPFISTMLVFGLWGVATAAFSVAPPAALRFAGQVIVQTLILIMMLGVLNSSRRVGRAMWWTMMGGVIASLTLVVTGGVSSQFGRATLGEFANPNTTALAISVAVAAIPGAWAFSRFLVVRLLCVAAAPLLLFAMVKTGSRSALISIVAAFSIGVVLAKGGNFAKRGLIALALVTLTVGTFFVVLNANVLNRKAQERLEALVHKSESVTEDSRTVIWGMALQTYLSHPLFGVGYGSSAFAMRERHGIERDVHNSYLGSLIDGGPIGLALFFYALIRLIGATRHCTQARTAVPSTILLVLALVSGLTHTIHFSKWFWVPVTLSLLLAEQARRDADAAVAPVAEPPRPRGAFPRMR